MNGRGRRSVLLLLALVLLLVWKSHGRLPKEAPVAFVRYTGAAGLFIKIKRDDCPVGIYKFPDGVMVKSVINVTTPKVIPECADIQFLHQKLTYHSSLLISHNCGKKNEIFVRPMAARDLLLLGVPLDPNRMDVADWQAVPGVGPTLARDIVRDRQIYGDFDGPQSLLRVPGVGERTLNDIIKNF